MILVLLIFDKTIYYSLLVGAFYGYYEKQIWERKVINNKWACCSIAVSPFAAYCFPMLMHGRYRFVVDISFICFFFSVQKLAILNQLFSKVMRLGHVSFGIYSLHWPVFCTLGLAMLTYIHIDSLFFLYIVAILVSALVTLLLAILFRLTVENWSEKVSKKINIFLLKIIYPEEWCAINVNKPNDEWNIAIINGIDKWAKPLSV